MDDPSALKTDREDAVRTEIEAKRERSLLLNETKRMEDSDFYPYRYLASEGLSPATISPDCRFVLLFPSEIRLIPLTVHVSWPLPNSDRGMFSTTKAGNIESMEWYYR